MTDDAHLERINALTRNARQTWFALLAALVFVGITLMGVEHIDFYGVDRATRLPVVNIDIPTRLFFIAAPILIAAIYGYFHLYLIRLSDALGKAPTRLNGIRLGDAITPWLVSDAALAYRASRREDNCTTQRKLDAVASLLNLLLAWGFGLIVLAFLWSQSLPARAFWMSAIAGTAFFVALFTGIGSLNAMRDRLSRVDQHRQTSRQKGIVDIAILILAGCAGVLFSYPLTNGPAETLASLDLSGEAIVERPSGWLPYDLAREDVLAHWCKRVGAPCRLSELDPDQRSSFDAEWQARRAIALADMRKPDWSLLSNDPTNMDFRAADLSNSFLVDATLRGARMVGANLSEAQMEGANLSGAQIEGADLNFSILTGRKDRPSFLSNTNLGRSINQGGMLRFVDLTGAEFDSDTDFRNAFLDGSVVMTNDFRDQMGRPCQWADQRLDDAAFFGRWRGWIEARGTHKLDSWSMNAPEGFEDVTPILPPEGCGWKTGPMPGAEGE